MTERSASACLSEDRLVAMFYGEADPSEQEHRRSCADCARRYRRLGSDLARIGAALELPEPSTARASEPARLRAARRVRLAWLPLAASVVVGFLLVWQWAGQSQVPVQERVAAVDPSGTSETAALTMASPDADAGPADSLGFDESIEELAAAIFMDDPFDSGDTWSGGAGGDYLRSALDGDYPCTDVGPAGAVGCAAAYAYLDLGLLE